MPVWIAGLRERMAPSGHPARLFYEQDESPTSSPTLAIVGFKKTPAIPISALRYLVVVLVPISLTVSNVDHLRVLIYHLHTFLSQVSFQIFCLLLKIGLFVLH